MGVVYLARQLELNRLVALKTLSGRFGPHELLRFTAEAETAAALHHNNIAHIYEVGECDGAPFYSMEYLKDGSLADRLRKELPAPREVAQLMIQVARALHFAHQNGVVHRDMKPANILLDAEGVPKITDFGIAKRLMHDAKLTRTGDVIGTPVYMAPEQAKASRDVGPGADIYAFGAILYELLCGRPPFLAEEAETPITIRVLTEDPVSPAWHRPEVPRDLETICMKCLEKDPRHRYASAAAVAEDLRRFLDDEPIVARPSNRLKRGVKWVRRHPWKFIGATASIAAIIAVLMWSVFWVLYQRPRTEYAATLKTINGAMDSDIRLTASEAARREISFRLTRKGHTLEVRLIDKDKNEGKDRISFACDLSGRYTAYPMVDPVVKGTKYC
jgi:eukaryotic-like serine/threonine-protein kinase